jgi:pyruvate,orthophosphate dikinase
VFDAVTAVSWAAAGREVVLVRLETSAHDVGGMIAAAAVVTARVGSPRTRRSSPGASGVPV